jgi:hypothetical protein
LTIIAPVVGVASLSAKPLLILKANPVGNKEPKVAKRMIVFADGVKHKVFIGVVVAPVATTALLL